MTVYVVEDEIFQLEDILITLEDLGHKTIGNSDDPFEAQEQIGKLKPDVVLMDIHLNGKQAGVALAKRITNLYKTPVIFTSSETDKAIISDTAEIAPIAYLTKPINDRDLRAALVLAESRNLQQKEIETEAEDIFIKNGNKLVKVPINSILFAHTDTKNYCTIITDDGKKLSIRTSILGLQKLLNHDTFVQTHRAYVINKNKIDFLYETDQAIDIQGHTIPVGRTFKQDLYKLLKVL